MTEVEKQSSGTLNTLAKQINEEHRAFVDSFKKTAEHGIRAGELLVEAKSKCKHGEWLLWLDANFEGSQRTAQTYMQIFNHRDELRANAQSSAHLSINGALKELSTPLLSTPSEAEEQPTPRTGLVEVEITKHSPPPRTFTVKQESDKARQGVRQIPVKPSTTDVEEDPPEVEGEGEERPPAGKLPEEGAGFRPTKPSGLLDAMSYFTFTGLLEEASRILDGTNAEDAATAVLKEHKVQEVRNHAESVAAWLSRFLDALDGEDS
jgi:hypothetical protein